MKLLLTICIGLLCFQGVTVAYEKVSEKASGKRVLVFSGTGWYRHPEIPLINTWLAQQADKLKMEVGITETPKDFDKLLADYDVLVINNSNELVQLLNVAQRKAIEAWYSKGGGIVALHAALVHQTDWKWFHELGGCDFNSDSDYLPATVTVDPENADHPAVKGFGPSFTYSADWTNHDVSVSGKPGFRVLLRVDESTYEPVRDFFQKRNGKAMGKDHPIAWCHENGGGRFFYTELGHDVQSLNTEFGTQHYIQAVRWAAGLVD